MRILDESYHQDSYSRDLMMEVNLTQSFDLHDSSLCNVKQLPTSTSPPKSSHSKQKPKKSNKKSKKFILPKPVISGKIQVDD